MSVSIVVNYYNNEKALKTVVKHFAALTRAKPGFFELVLVDDHSPEPTDLSIFEGCPDVRLFRLTKDIRWNMPGARNIGALEARMPQIFFCDVDHMLYRDELEAFVRDSENLPLGTRIIANRKRPLHRQTEGETLKPNINVFLIHRQDFFRAGGYEELYAGHYGQEDKYFRYCCRWNGIEEAPASFSVTALGGSTRHLDRDKSRNEAMLETMVRLNSWKARDAFLNPYVQIL